MSEPVNRNGTSPRFSNLGILLFALAWGSLMILILGPRDLFISAPPGLPLQESGPPAASAPAR